MQSNYYLRVLQCSINNHTQPVVSTHISRLSWSFSSYLHTPRQQQHTHTHTHTRSRLTPHSLSSYLHVEAFDLGEVAAIGAVRRDELCDDGDGLEGVHGKAVARAVEVLVPEAVPGEERAGRVAEEREGGEGGEGEREGEEETGRRRGKNKKEGKKSEKPP